MVKNIKKMFFIVLMLGLLGGLTEYFGPSIGVDKESVINSKESIEASGLAPIVSAEGAILIDAEDGSVIYEKDADKKLYPASTTKIMTAIVALEILDEIDAELSSKTIVPNEAIGVEGSSVYLKEDEIITIEELLYGTMLQSGNDAATALAICLGGTEKNFIARMNEKAHKLGCESTNYINPSGLFDENHYTTARELARISGEAMRNKDFRKIVGSSNWVSDGSGRNFINKNKAVSEYPGATGVKIGYTKKSGRTLVAAAKRGDVELIAVVLNDSNWFEDAYSMLDYGFERKGIE